MRTLPGTFYVVLFVSVPLSAGNPISQETGTGIPSRRGETAEIKKGLQKEVSRLDNESPSTMLARLTGPDQAGAESRLSAEQMGLVVRLDKLTRAILGDWLLRGLEKSDSKDLVERLTDRGLRVRKEIVAHAEAIALEGILTPDQVDRLRSNSTPREASKSGPQRDRANQRQRPSSKKSSRAALSKKEFDELRSTIDSLIATMYINSDSVSEYFSSLTAKDALVELQLSSEQSQLIGQLDQLTRNIIRSWMLRGLDGKKPPIDLADRVSDRGREWTKRIIAHAEAMVTRGLLTPVQAEASKRRLWRQMGSRALLDRELASRLRLTREQVDEIAIRVANKARVTEDSDRNLGPFRALVLTNMELARQADREIRRRIVQADGLIWDVLDPFQMDRLEELVQPRANLPARRR
jgi:hypothetical protein